MTYEEEIKAVQDAIATFPPEFGLKAFPGKRFYISKTHSFVDGDKIMLYTMVRRPDGDLAFCKGTVEELRREVMELACLPIYKTHVYAPLDEQCIHCGIKLPKRS